MSIRNYRERVHEWQIANSIETREYDCDAIKITGIELNIKGAYTKRKNIFNHTLFVVFNNDNNNCIATADLHHEQAHTHQM